MELSPKYAVVPGSFDPITVGHLDIIERASRMFERVTVAVLVNSEKKYLFSPEERLGFARAAVAGLANVDVVRSEGLLSDTAAACGAGVLVKGARCASDFEYELSLAAIMREFLPGLETVILPSKPELAHVSSTYARDLIKFGAPAERAVPKTVIPLLRDAINKQASKGE